MLNWHQFATSAIATLARPSFGSCSGGSSSLARSTYVLAVLHTCACSVVAQAYLLCRFQEPPKKPYPHPLVDPLIHSIREHKHTKRWLTRLIDARVRRARRQVTRCRGCGIS